MNKETSELLESLKADAIKKAELNFDATFIECEKNIFLLKRKKGMDRDNPYMTTCVNFHNMSFNHGHYDMGLSESVENFKGRVAESSFNPDYDLPRPHEESSFSM